MSAGSIGSLGSMGSQAVIVNRGVKYPTKKVMKPKEITSLNGTTGGTGVAESNIKTARATSKNMTSPLNNYRSQAQIKNAYA